MLYPPDHSPQGKELRLRQQYFFTHERLPWLTFMLNGELGYADGYNDKPLPFFKNFYLGGVGGVRELVETETFRKIKSNLRFVVSVAKQYQNQGLSLNDLINEGNLGLMKAAQRFDETRGFKFISYAVWWVRQAVLKALAEQTRSVRIPLNQNSQLIRLSRAETVLAQVLRREFNPRYYDLMLEMEKLTGNGVVLNTSLNRRGEPMICSPTDALNMFFGSDLEYLIMEDVLVTKASAAAVMAAVRALRAHVSATRVSAPRLGQLTSLHGSM